MPEISCGGPVHDCAARLRYIDAMGSRSREDVALDYTFIAEKIFQRGYETKEEGELIYSQ